MSKYIGKRVSYPCKNCGVQFTVNKKTIELSDGSVFCSHHCLDDDKMKNGLTDLVEKWKEASERADKEANSIDGKIASEGQDSDAEWNDIFLKQGIAFAFGKCTSELKNALKQTYRKIES